MGMTVRELIHRLLELPLDKKILIEVNGAEEYEIEDLYPLDMYTGYSRVLIQIDGVPVEGEE